jgi:ribosome-associated protein
MAKKQFGWVRDAEEPVIPSPPRPSRRDKRKPSQKAEEIREALEARTPKEWKRLPLGAVAVEALKEVAAIRRTNHGALRRARLHLTGLLRAEDCDALTEALGLGRQGSHGSVLEQQDDALVRLRTRLVEGGDAVLAELIDTYPDADRQRIRQLCTRSRSEDERAASRAKKRLLAALRELQRG